MTFPLSYGTDIKTRVVLNNETSHSVVTPGMAGKVGLIGAMPSEKSDVIAVTSYADFLREYGLSNTTQEEQYDGMRAIKYLFMTQFPTVAGATSVTCVNINTTYQPENTLTLEIYEALAPEKARMQQRLEEVIARITEINADSNKNKEPLKTELANLTAEKKELEDHIAEIDDLLEVYSNDDIPRISADRHLTFKKLKLALHQLADEDLDILFISSDLRDCIENNATDNTQAKSIGEVYQYILDFVDNKFTSHHPLTYLGWVKTSADSDIAQFTDGIGSKIINVNGDGSVDVSADPIDYSDVQVWGAKQIAQMFTKETNELSTCGLFIQGGTINGEEVDVMELSAHICGWIAGMKVGTDLTYQTIPGLTSINEELYFGKNDAGTILNNYGIQIIKPKDRLNKTFYVNNSIMPSGWHTNHVRSVIYLLKKYAFEAGLGINHFTANVEAFRASLENVSKDVMNEVDVIRSVTIGDIETINNYHIFVPVDIVLAGVITKVSVGVSMSIDETGNVASTQTTSGYNFYY